MSQKLFNKYKSSSLLMSKKGCVLPKPKNSSKHGSEPEPTVIGSITQGHALPSSPSIPTDRISAIMKVIKLTLPPEKPATPAPPSKDINPDKVADLSQFSATKKSKVLEVLDDVPM